VEKTTHRGALCSVLIKNYTGELIYKNELGGACGNVYFTGEVHRRFW